MSNSESPANSASKDHGSGSGGRRKNVWNVSDIDVDEGWSGGGRPANPASSFEPKPVLEDVPLNADLETLLSSYDTLIAKQSKHSVLPVWIESLVAELRTKWQLLDSERDTVRGEIKTLKKEKKAAEKALARDKKERETEVANWLAKEEQWQAERAALAGTTEKESVARDKENTKREKKLAKREREIERELEKWEKREIAWAAEKQSLAAEIAAWERKDAESSTKIRQLEDEKARRDRDDQATPAAPSAPESSLSPRSSRSDRARTSGLSSTAKKDAEAPGRDRERAKLEEKRAADREAKERAQVSCAICMDVVAAVSRRKRKCIEVFLVKDYHFEIHHDCVGDEELWNGTPMVVRISLSRHAVNGSLKADNNMLEYSWSFEIGPYLTSCGHSFCLACLDQHFLVSPPPTCPACRTRVEGAPLPNLGLESMAESVVERLPSPDRAWHHRRTAAAKTRVRSEPGLWEQHFPTVQSAALIDYEDGVRRCGVCAWEVVGGRCTGCNQVYGGSDTFSSDADDLDPFTGLSDEGSDLGVATVRSTSDGHGGGWSDDEEGEDIRLAVHDDEEEESEELDEYDFDDPFLDDGPLEAGEISGSEEDGSEGGSEDDYVESESGSDDGGLNEAEDSPVPDTVIEKESPKKPTRRLARRSAPAIAEAADSSPPKRRSHRNHVVPKSSSLPAPTSSQSSRSALSPGTHATGPSRRVQPPPTQTIASSDDDLVTATADVSSSPDVPGLRRTGRKRRTRAGASDVATDAGGGEVDDLVIDNRSTSVGDAALRLSAVNGGSTLSSPPTPQPPPRIGVSQRNKRRIESDEDEIVAADDTFCSPGNASKGGRKRTKRRVVESDGEI
ncbi:E3 ubiquitin ligase [Gonapodya sp. JEL0774]|nr:E3 ubiquitin ligase [Gonapodya sp. JEL0774]